MALSKVCVRLSVHRLFVLNLRRLWTHWKCILFWPKWNYASEIKCDDAI